jgi:hypothetical protein
MRKMIIAILILSTVILCVFLLRNITPDRKPIFHPFDINFNITKESLINNGYSRIVEDVTLIGKRKNDTLIYYQLKEKYIDNSEKVFWRNCEIRFNKPDSVEIVNLIRRYDCYIISEWNMKKPRFFVRNRKNNMIYDCSIHQNKELRDVLSISMFFPDIE